VRASRDSVPQTTNPFAGLIGRGVRGSARLTNRREILRRANPGVESPAASYAITDRPPRFLLEIDVGQRQPVVSRTVKQASVSSTDQGRGKRRAEGMGVTGKLTHPVCGVVNASWFAVCAASVMSVPPWPSAAVTKLAAM
jgi:hypothetical protein